MLPHSANAFYYLDLPVMLASAATTSCIDSASQLPLSPWCTACEQSVVELINAVAAAVEACLAGLCSFWLPGYLSIGRLPTLLCPNSIS